MRKTQSARPALNLCFGALLGLSALAVGAQGALAQDTGSPGTESSGTGSPGSDANETQPADSGETKSEAQKPVTEEKASKKKEEKIKTGVIANQGSFGFGPRTIDSADGGSSPGEDPTVITAGVTRVGSGKCSTSLTNLSKENSYSASYSVHGYNSRGVKVLDKSFSASLKPGEVSKRELACQDGLNMFVELRSARKR